MGRYDLAMTSDANAQNVKKVVEGFKALLTIHGGDLEASKKIIDGLKCTAKGELVQVSWTASIEDIQAAIQAHIQKIKGPRKSEK